MKKALSYIWPTTQRFSSEINGTLEVTYINGKKVLDTANANYSYGSLQKILEFGISKIDLKSVENMLLLGMGGGSIIHSLRKKIGFYEPIVAVEIDSEIIKIAKKEFDIEEDVNLKIIEQDALEYVKTSKEKFQLIIIDLFIDTTVPPIFFEKEFCSNVSQLLQNKGEVIFNVGIKLENKSEIQNTVISHFGKDFKFQIHQKVNGTNTLLIGKKSV